MMAEIYTLASNVCVWLGAHEHNSQMALSFIAEQVSNLGAFDEITENDKFADHWKAFAVLINRSSVSYTHLTLPTKRIV